MVAMQKMTRAWLAGLVCAVLVPWAVPAAASTFVDGEFTTYDQNIWGADPLDGPPASLLKARFFDLFTAGSEFGFPFPGGNVMDFSSADAMSPCCRKVVHLPRSTAALQTQPARRQACSPDR